MDKPRQPPTSHPHDHSVPNNRENRIDDEPLRTGGHISESPWPRFTHRSPKPRFGS